MNMQEFNKKIREWCPSPEFQEIYKINHPTEQKNEVHFIKKGIRVCCVKKYDDLYFYLNAECFLHKEKEILTLKSGKEQLFDKDKRDKLLSLFVNKKRVIENRITIIHGIKRIFNYR